MNQKESERYNMRSRLHTAPKSKYRILALVGQGQFGKVFCAVNRQTGKIVALKELSHDKAPTKKFLRELGSAIIQEHPNIVTCYTLEHTDTSRYLVMDYCEGGTLRHLLEQNGSLRLAEALKLIIGILEGLESLHQRGIVHCDIKPENILLTLGSDGWIPRLSDFGIALEFSQSKKTSSSKADTIMGSPGYMAPEQFLGLYSPASDIYAVGIILYEMIVGERPFKGIPSKLMWAHMNERKQLPESIPEPLRAIGHKSLEKLPARRFGSAAEMATAIRQAAETPQVKQYSKRRLPWETPTKPTCLKPLPESYRKIVPYPLNQLTSCETKLYGVAENEIIFWKAPYKLPGRVKLPEKSEKVLALQARPQGCLVLTPEQIYWIGISQYQAHKLLHISQPFTAAISPQSRCLAVASTEKLYFYSLSGLENITATPLYNCHLSEAALPELIFLNERYLLAIWNISTNHQSCFKIYNLRGQEIIVFHLPVQFRHDKNHRCLVLNKEPYTTIFGINSDSTAALRIQLKPWQITRIPLEIEPEWWGVFGNEYFVASPQGEIIFYDSRGQEARILKAPKNILAVTAWGKNNIAIATHQNEQSYLYFIKLEADKKNECHQ